jgi:hypothetical protein
MALIGIYILIMMISATLRPGPFGIGPPLFEGLWFASPVISFYMTMDSARYMDAWAVGCAGYTAAAAGVYAFSMWFFAARRMQED